MAEICWFHFLKQLNCSKMMFNSFISICSGKKVIVGENQTMAVGDHDFTKSGITPSVNLVVSTL